MERDCPAFGISRNTIRRYLRSETKEPAYAERRSNRAIDQYAFQLSAMLKTAAARSRKAHAETDQRELKGAAVRRSYDQDSDVRGDLEGGAI